MSIPVLAAAKVVCQIKEWKATNLEVQKLIYMTHMILLGSSKGKTKLVEEPFEAWDYGPVLPSLYHTLKVFRAGAIPKDDIFSSFDGVEIPASGTEVTMLKDAVEALRDRTSAELVADTHEEDGAWQKNYSPGVRGRVISDKDIIGEYRERAERAG